MNNKQIKTLSNLELDKIPLGTKVKVITDKGDFWFVRNINKTKRVGSTSYVGLEVNDVGCVKGYGEIFHKIKKDGSTSVITIKIGKKCYSDKNYGFELVKNKSGNWVTNWRNRFPTDVKLSIYDENHKINDIELKIHNNKNQINDKKEQISSLTKQISDWKLEIKNIKKLNEVVK